MVEASRATSVPERPIAMPMSARRSAGASLTPSPVIATTWPSAAQRVGDAQLRLRRAAREDQLVAAAQQLVELGLAHRVQLLAGDHGRVLADDTDLAGDRGCREAVVAGDHDDPDARAAWQRATASATSGPRRVEHRDEPEEAELALRLLATLGDGIGVAQCAAGDGQHAQPAAGLRVDQGRELAALGVGQRTLATVGAEDARAARRAPTRARPWCRSTARRRARRPST